MLGNNSGAASAPLAVALVLITSPTDSDIDVPLPDLCLTSTRLTWLNEGWTDINMVLYICVGGTCYLPTTAMTQTFPTHGCAGGIDSGGGLQIEVRVVGL